VQARLGSELVFVNQAAESVVAAEPIELGQVGRSVVVRRQLGERRPLPERAMRPVLVVMERVGRHDAFEVPAADDGSVRKSVYAV
jgi:hypothetical protein